MSMRGLSNVSLFPPQPSPDCGGRCSRSWKRLVKPSRMICWMLACQFMEQWGATSASVLTTLPKWVCRRHTLVFHMLTFLLHLCFASLCHSGVRRHGVRRSARDGRPPTPYRAGPVRHVVRCAGWISGVVSDVRQPSPRHAAAVMKEVLVAKHAH